MRIRVTNPNYRYGKWSGNPRGHTQNQTKCVEYVLGDHISRQCSRNRGHGLGELFCKQHGKAYEKQFPMRRFNVHISDKRLIDDGEFRGIIENRYSEDALYLAAAMFDDDYFHTVMMKGERKAFHISIQDQNEMLRGRGTMHVERSHDGTMERTFDTGIIL